jgi:hypothetical protein
LASHRLKKLIRHPIILLPVNRGEGLEKLDDEFVHSRACGERQGFTNKAPEALAQGVVEALDVMCRAPFWVAGLVLAGPDRADSE